MSIAWERIIWRRELRLQVEVPRYHQMSLSLVNALAIHRVFITEIRLDRLEYVLAKEAGALVHEPAAVTITMRTRSPGREAQLLRYLSDAGYVWNRS